MTKAVRVTLDGEIDPYGDIRDEIEVALERHLGRALRAQERRILETLGDGVDLSALDLAFWHREYEELVSILEPHMARAALAAAQVIPASVPILWDEPVLAEQTINWARRYAGEFVTMIDDTTRNMVQEAVSTFHATPGMTMGQLRESMMPAFNEVRAQRIAVTETTRAFTEGQKLVKAEIERGGLKMERIWRTSMDEIVCDLCAPLADKRESEGWDGYEPPRHVNCRCWTVLALPRETG